MKAERKITLVVDRGEAEIIRAALAAHRNALATAIRKAGKDADHKAHLTAESRSVSQMLIAVDNVLFKAAL